MRERIESIFGIDIVGVTLIYILGLISGIITAIGWGR
jgi:hypothetical protein